MVFLSFPPLADVEIDIDWEVKFGYYDGGPSDGVHYKIIVYARHAT